MEELLTMKEASKVLKINTGCMNALRTKGLIRCLKLGSWKVRRSELDRFIRDSEGSQIRFENKEGGIHCDIISTSN